MALAWILLLTLPAPSPAQQGRTISLNQKRVRIEQLVEQIGEATERTILFSDEVRGTVSIVAKRPVTLDEAWSILGSSLSMLGFSLLPSTVGNWRIAKVADAVGESPFRASVSEESDSFVTALIPLRFADLTDVLKVLGPLSGSRVTIVPYEPSNSLIASGPERAIARLTNLADELDRVEEQSLRSRVLRHRDVVEVESFVEGYLDSLGSAGRDLEIWSDQRTNSLVVRGNEDGVERVLDFVQEVDQPIEGGGSIRILRVLHRDAEEVAELIRTFADPGQSLASELVDSATPLDGADFSIAVDGKSRSLVVRAEPDVHRAIREVLEILDVQPELIAIDITVSELRTPKTYGLSFGFQLPFASGNDSSDLLGVVTNPISTQATPTLLGRVSRDTGVSFQSTDGSGATVTVPVLQTGAIAALDFRGTNEILIQPSLIVTAGEQHEIFVGDNVPIPVTEDSGIADPDATNLSLSALTRTTRFDRKDIGTRLGVEVRSGREGKIQLDLEVELSNFDLTRLSLGGDPTAVGPAYVEQSLSVRARLDDGETAVLAMDRQEKETNVLSGVPFLMDLPFFGWAFRTRGTLVENVHLIIAARARRVSNPAELVADTIRRRLAFERHDSRVQRLPTSSSAPYGVRVTTRLREDDALAISDSLALRGLQTTTHRWSHSGTEYYDVYVTELDSMADAAAVADELSQDGWQADLVLLSPRR